jgi:glycine/D-amino acid oxidase-like deaminating enzyme
MNIKTENLIIGSGIFGLSIASHLLKIGQKVCIVDKSSNPNEASSNALGRIDPILGGAGHGHETKPIEVAKKSLEAYKIFFNLNNSFKESIDFEIRPTVHFYEDENQFNSIDNVINEIDPERKFFSLENLSTITDDISYLNNDFYKAKSLFNGTIFLDSRKYKNYLEEDSRKKGLSIIEDEILGINNLRDNPTLVSDNNTYIFKRLIITTGPWSNQLIGKSENINIYPSKGQIVKLEDPNNKFTNLHLHGPCSLIKKRDGLIWIAATVEDNGFDKTITSSAASELINKASKMYKGIEQFPFHSQTACLRPSVDNDLPIIKKLNNEVYLASGGGGWGIMMSIMVGEILEKEFN